MHAKFLFPLTIMVLLLLLAFAVQPTQAALTFQTVPTAHPNIITPGAQQPSPTAIGTTIQLTPTQANTPGQGSSSSSTLYICGGLLILGSVVTYILIIRRRGKSNNAA